MSGDSDQSYSVGYKKPPKNGQFKHGQSGNPRGRPKRERQSLLQVLDAELQKNIKLSENGKEMSVTKGEATIKRLVNSAINGNERSIAILIRLMPMLHEFFKDSRLSEAILRAQQW